MILDPAILESATLEDLEKLIELDEWEKIEWAEHRSSEKARKFIKAFFDRANEAGRHCSQFVAIGGNRSSKSFTTGRGCFSKYLRDRARNGDLFWAGSPNLDKSITGPQKEVWDALPSAMFMGRAWDSKVGFGGHATIKIRVRDGGHCTVKFRSAEQPDVTFESDKLRGIWWDENLPESLYNRLLPRLIDLDGFFLYSDINNQAWPIERLEEAAPAAGVYYQNFSMFDNAENLPPGAIEKFMAKLPQDEIDLRVHGKPGVMEGVVFKQYRDFGPTKHVIEPFVIPDEWPKWRAIDYGSSAPTACIWVAIGPNEQAFVYREHYERNNSVGVNARQIIAASGDEKYVQTFMDPHAVDKPPAVYGSSPTVAEQYAVAGIQATGWPFVQIMGEHAMVQRIKFRLEKRTLFFFETCTSMRREMRVWKHQLDKDGKPKASDCYENDNNHLIDCLKGWLGTNPAFTQSSDWSFR